MTILIRPLPQGYVICTSTRHGIVSSSSALGQYEEPHTGCGMAKRAEEVREKGLMLVVRWSHALIRAFSGLQTQENIIAASHNHTSLDQALYACEAGGSFEEVN